MTFLIILGIIIYLIIGRLIVLLLNNNDLIDIVLNYDFEEWFIFCGSTVFPLIIIYVIIKIIDNFLYELIE